VSLTLVDLICFINLRTSIGSVSLASFGLALFTVGIAAIFILLVENLTRLHPRNGYVWYAGHWVLQSGSWRIGADYRTAPCVPQERKFSGRLYSDS
jgi:hypothetical protein